VQTLNAELEITIRNPYNAEYEVATMKAAFRASVDFELFVLEDQYSLVANL